MPTRFVKSVLILSLSSAAFTGLIAQQTPAATVVAHPATVEQIKQIMTLTHAIDRSMSAIANSIEIQKKQGPQIFPDAFWTDVKAELDKIDWVAMAVPIYQRSFSQEEAIAVIAFYSTPVGQKTLETSETMANELQSQGYAIGKEIGGRVAEKYKDEIEAKMKKLPQTAPAPSPQ